MEIYKERFTHLEKEILNFLFANSGKNFNQRAIALALKVSPTAVANSIKGLKKTGLLEIKKNPISETFEIGLNFQNNKVTFMKRAENLKAVYESGLAGFLFDKYHGSTIILFGSYSFGEDHYNSDIDIAVIGSKEKNTNLDHFEKILLKKITIQFYDGWDKIHKNLKESILNGIILKGSVRL